MSVLEQSPRLIRKVAQRATEMGPADFIHYYVGRVAHGDATQAQWHRRAMNEAYGNALNALDASSLSAAEISGTTHAGRGWLTYDSLSYPDFDLCDPPDHGTYDVVVCDQVLEHVANPLRAVATLRNLLNPGGLLIVGTPFMVRVHRCPGDYWRFTEDGLRVLLEGAGLTVTATGSWGNARAVKANLRRWALYWPWRSMRDDPDLAMSVWAFATR